MDEKQVGELTPRYSFILNPYQDERISRCVKCLKLTFVRKFALFIHIYGYGPLVLGKTCRYCSKCELIVVHQDELEGELAICMSRLAPEVIGNEYLVIGTMEKNFWKKGLKQSNDWETALKHVSQFANVLELKIEPGGWVQKPNG